jgi:hypothetical protein
VCHVELSHDENNDADDRHEIDILVHICIVGFLVARLFSMFDFLHRQTFKQRNEAKEKREREKEREKVMNGRDQQQLDFDRAK